MTRMSILRLLSSCQSDICLPPNQTPFYQIPVAMHLAMDDGEFSQTLLTFQLIIAHRICPGQHLADTSLFIAIVSVLSMFKISNAIDKKTGLPITPEPRCTTGIIRQV